MYLNRRVDLAVDSSTSDISHVLHNAGKGFADSDEEEAAIKRRRWANFQSDSEDDDFFITDKTTRLKGISFFVFKFCLKLIVSSTMFEAELRLRSKRVH